MCGRHHLPHWTHPRPRWNIDLLMDFFPLFLLSLFLLLEQEEKNTTIDKFSVITSIALRWTQKEIHPIWFFVTPRTLCFMTSCSVTLIIWKSQAYDSFRLFLAAAFSSLPFHHNDSSLLWFHLFDFSHFLWRTDDDWIRCGDELYKERSKSEVFNGDCGEGFPGMDLLAIQILSGGLAISFRLFCGLHFDILPWIFTWDILS